MGTKPNPPIQPDPNNPSPFPSNPPVPATDPCEDKPAEQPNAEGSLTPDKESL